MRADRIGTVIAAALFSTGVAAATRAQAQDGYPNRPVSLIVPYAPGGVADVGMRLLGEKLSARLHQQFVVENRPGAAGIVAAQAAAAAAPDGYTLLMTGNNTAIAAALFKSLPYNVLTDFESVSTAAFFNILLVTRAGSPRRAPIPESSTLARSIPAARRTLPRNSSPARQTSKPRSCRFAPRRIWRAP
jgi:tripartite-type tricarboxylate transporter receptor subunit TctC